ncbi:UNVERIFIED_CONTAM: hypothetical protein GTU68_001612 [Idotea baltica]|nr:hypothetical protein [Idotea baltica]
MKAFKSIDSAPVAVAAYSPAVQSGKLVFLSGQIAIDPVSNTLVEGGVEAECKQVLTNLRAVLKGVDLGPASVVMTTIFLADMADYKVVNELYAEFVNADAPPARQAVAVKELPLGALVEISLIAEAE